MRLLEQAKIPYENHYYSNAISGLEVATVLNQDPEQLFKTLVTIGKTGAYYVFIVPVNKALDLKKGAKAVCEKSIEMIKEKELFPLTGYVHGGCSPIGMKKLFATVLDESANAYKTIIFSGGSVGYQIELKPDDLHKIVPFLLRDIVVE